MSSKDLGRISSPSNTQGIWIPIPELFGGTDLITSVTATTDNAAVTVPAIAATTVEKTHQDETVWAIGLAAEMTIVVSTELNKKVKIQISWASVEGQSGEAEWELTVESRTYAGLSQIELTTESSVFSEYRIERYGGKPDDLAHDNREPLLKALEANKEVTFGHGTYSFLGPVDAARLKALYGFSITGVRPEVSHQHYENPAGFDEAGSVLRFDNPNETDWCFDVDTATAQGDRLGPVVIRDLVLRNNNKGSSLRIADEADTASSGKNSVGVYLNNIILTKPNEIYSVGVGSEKFPFLDQASPAGDKRIDKTSPVTWGLKLTKAYDCVLENVRVRGHRYAIDVLGSDSIQASGLRTSFSAWGVRHYRASGPTVPGRWYGIYTEGSSACQVLLDTGSVFGMRTENSTAQPDLGVWDTTGLTFTWAEGAEYVFITGFTGGFDVTDYFEPLLPITLTNAADGHQYTIGISEVNSGDNSLRVMNYDGYCYANRALTGTAIRRYFGIQYIMASGETSAVDPEISMNIDYPDLPIWAVYPSPCPALISGARSTFNTLDQADNKGIVCGWTPGQPTPSPPGPAILIEGGNRLNRADHPLAVRTGMGFYDKAMAPYYEAPAASVHGLRWAGTCGMGMRDSTNIEWEKLEMRKQDDRWGVTLAYVSFKGREWVLSGLKPKASWTINWKVDLVAETGAGNQSVRFSTHHETDNVYVNERSAMTVTEVWQTFGGSFASTIFAAGQENFDFRLALRSNSGAGNLPVLVGDFEFYIDEVV